MAKRKITQCEKLINLLKAGRSVTRVTAMHYGIMNLTARIADLRLRYNLNVICTRKNDANGNSYGSFSLPR